MDNNSLAFTTYGTEVEIHSDGDREILVITRDYETGEIGSFHIEHNKIKQVIEFLQKQL